MKRWRWLFRRAQMEAELDEEIESHLAMAEKAYRERGLDARAAREAALAEFGGVARIKDEVRDSWGARAWDALSRDLRIAARALVRSRGYAAVVVLTLALGIGAGTAIFSVVRGVLLRPLPYAAGDRLVRIKQQVPAAGIDDLAFSPLEVADYRAQARSFDAVAEYHSMSFILIGAGDPVRVTTGVVSANYFDMLGVKPILGRAFARGEDAHGAPPVLLLGHAFWQKHLGARKDIVGQTVELNDQPHVVVGVLPPIPLYPDDNDVYMPTSACPFRSSDRVEHNRKARMSLLFGRLAPGVDAANARAELATISQRIRTVNPETYQAAASYRANLIPVGEEMTLEGRSRLLVLLGLAGFVLLIVCANVANLTLARGLRRSHEMAVRTALGAGRWRLLRQLLCEGLLVSLAGGGLGLLASLWARDVLAEYAARFSPRAGEIQIDGAVAAFALGLSILTGLAVTALPALPPLRSLAAAIAEDGVRSEGGGRRRLWRSALVVAQVAVSFMLLIGAGLTARTLVELERVKPGFNPENVLTMQIDLDWTKYVDPKSPRAQAFARLLERVQSSPGVAAAAIGTTFPLNEQLPFGAQFEVEGRPHHDLESRPRADFLSVSADYFRAVGIPIVAGRSFGAEDVAEAPETAVVNQSLARRYFGSDQAAIGKRVRVDGNEQWTTIVGVAGDARQVGLDRAVTDEFYRPLMQSAPLSAALLVRTRTDPLTMVRQIRELVREVDTRFAVAKVRSLEQVRAESLASPRLTALLLGLFAALALVITATGIGGVLAVTVTQRTREIGIRMALGARRGEVIAMVLGQGLRLVAIGLVLGAGGALALSHLLAALLFGVAPTDPITFVGVAAVLLAVAVVACLLPARRAAGIDPMIALRAG